MHLGYADDTSQSSSEILFVKWHGFGDVEEMGGTYHHTSGIRNYLLSVGTYF